MTIAAKLLSRLTDTGHRLQSIGGWQRLLTAAGLGVITALAQAPYYVLPLLFIGLTGLVLLIDSTQTARRPNLARFLTGWAFGFGYFMASMYWLALAFLVQADQFAWMIPILVPACMAFLGLFIALPVMIAGRWWSTDGRRVIVLAVALSLGEYARGHLFSGLPWNLFGQSFAGLALLAQPAAWIGPYGLSFIVTLMAVAPAAGWHSSSHGDWRFKPSAIAGAAFVALCLFGVSRMALIQPGNHDDVSILVAQPNLSQRDKLNPDKLNESLFDLIEMTKQGAASTGTTYAVWPENAYPYLAQAPDAQSLFGESLGENTILISGTLRTYTDQTDGTHRAANSLAVFDVTAAGEKPLAATYDKHHLVPFGEYLPAKPLLSALGLAQLAPAADGFTPGPGPATLSVGPLSFSPLICYEDVFPRQLYARRQGRPDILIVVTNDAWFGDNAGPKQHLAISRLRAIESGLPMARSANTGISAIIDARGQYVETLKLYSKGSIALIAPKAAGRTLYDRFGPFLYLLCLAVSAFLGGKKAIAMHG